MSLEDKEGRGLPCEVDELLLKAIIEDDPLKTTREVAQKLDVDHPIVVRRLGNWKGEEVEQIGSTLLLRNKNHPFLDREETILYDNRKRLDQWMDKDEAPKHLSMPKIHPKKTMISPMKYPMATQLKTVLVDKRDPT
ncbi:hypothetical protein RB195_022060 [Necator americanus]|uniref:Mos1 transposase HTH domain-containing protein n=1 Tax=Necator americanus TaxID=51031 RepID=A0ABR1EG10_NECAM